MGSLFIKFWLPIWYSFRGYSPQAPATGAAAQVRRRHLMRRPRKGPPPSRPRRPRTGSPFSPTFKQPVKGCRYCDWRPVRAAGHRNVMLVMRQRRRRLWPLSGGGFSLWVRRHLLASTWVTASKIS
jgi:hypothetical protein